MYIFNISIYGIHIAPTWYGLAYALGFIICYFFMKYHCKFRESAHLDSLLSFVFFGIILGGRIGYIVFYNLSYFIEHPAQILKIWEGGMSFHGGFLGTVIAVYVFCKKYGYQFWSLIDTLAIIIPIALGLGRIGNWINRELPGFTPYNGIFPMNIGGIDHFPSPLLEMFLEGIILFALMIISYRYIGKKNPGLLSGIFLIGYSTARLIAEGYRLPDVHIGYLFSTQWITLGILYTIPMMLYGIYLLIRK